MVPEVSITIDLERLERERCVVIGRENHGKGAVEVVVVLDELGTAHAYRNECMHVAIPLAILSESMFRENTLLCATHGARYRLEDGYCFEGPCLGQSLERLPIEFDGSVVRIRIDD